MSHINYSFNQTDDSLPRDKMKLRNIASTKYSGDWPSIPHSHSYAELFYIVDGAGQFQINDKLFPVQAHQLVVVNPNVIHTEVSLESHPLEYIVLGIEGLEFTISDAAEGSFCVYTFDGNNDVLSCMRKILTEISQTDKVFSAIAADHKRTCKKICMSVKPVRRQTVNLPGVVADNANAISPRTATFNITADKLLQCP